DAEYGRHDAEGEDHGAQLHWGVFTKQILRRRVLLYQWRATDGQAVVLFSHTPAKSGPVRKN
ncbi:MAG: hypothetical protein AAFO63_11215, partial [Pseudomonadota bacterium]